MSNEIATKAEQLNLQQSYCFASASSFETSQRMATALSKSTLVPKEYKDSLSNCLIALEVAHRVKASPLMVMQNLYIVHGKPSWSSQFVISAVNSCGKFKPLRFEMYGKEGDDDRGCVAWTLEKAFEVPSNIRTLDDAKIEKLPILESPRISINMAKAEGWFSKTGSKWQTMPDLMLRYRAASFFGKLYAPEILMGMQTQEEVEDITLVNVTASEGLPSSVQIKGNEGVKAALKQKASKATVDTETGEVLEINPAQAKADEIIAQLQKQISVTALDAITEENKSHISFMDDDMKNQISQAYSEKKATIEAMETTNAVSG